MRSYISSPLFACLAVTLLLALLPALSQQLSGAGWYGAANPQYLESYYTPMTREVSDGYPMMGNPYFFEHRSEVAPAFILPFWLSALPLMIDVPIPVTLAFNFVFWSLIFTTVLFALFRRIGMPARWACAAALVVYAQLYGQILRPVSMQVVHASFVLFLLAFFLWWERPRHFLHDALLGGAAAFAIYAYTYQLQIIAVFLGIVFARLLLLRQWDRVRHAIVAGAWIAVLCLPFALVTLAQLQNPAYMDSMIRIGLGFTRWPAGEAYVSAAAIGVFIALAYASHLFVFTRRGFRHASFALQFLFLGIAIVIVSYMNVVTGLDLETASHAARFVQLWLAIGTVVALYFLFDARHVIARLALSPRALLAVLLLIVIAFNVKYVGGFGDMLDISAARTAVGAIRDEQQMVEVIRWLDAREDHPVVVWTDPHSHLAFDIPIYSKHYVLFAVQGGLQLVPSAEVQERYLLAASLSDLTYDAIRNDLPTYGMNGYRMDTPYSINRGSRMCRVLHLQIIGLRCAPLVDTDMLFTSLYHAMYDRYTSEILPYRSAELEKFHVTYLMKDTLYDQFFHPDRMSGAHKVYDDGRFAIYQLIQG